MKKERIRLIIITSLVLTTLLLPMNIKANIICNDGTTSPSCSDCHRGCCSKHGGCTNNPNNGGRDYSQASNNYVQETPQEPAIDSEVTQESVEPQQENLDEYNEENIEETTNNQRTNNSNYYESNLNNVDNDDLISIIGALGFFATGIGIGYKVKKK